MTMDIFKLARLAYKIEEDGMQTLHTKMHMGFFMGCSYSWIPADWNHYNT